MVDVPDGYGEAFWDDFTGGFEALTDRLPYLGENISDGISGLFNILSTPGLNEPAAYLTAMITGVVMWKVAPMMVGGLLNTTPLGNTWAGGILQAAGSLALIGAAAYAAFVGIDNLDMEDAPRDPVEIIEPNAPAAPTGNGTVTAPTAPSAPTPSLWGN